MDYLVYVVALVLGYVFLTNRDRLEKATGFIIGLVFVSAIGMTLGGSSIISQIGWIAVCQFAWTLFHSVQVGFKRFRNTLVVACAILVVLGSTLFVSTISPQGFFWLAVILLLIRWCSSNSPTQAKKPDQNQEPLISQEARRKIGRTSKLWIHLFVQELDRQVERSARFAQVEIWPRLLNRRNRKVVLSLFFLTLFLTTWHGTNGLLVVPEGKVALVRNSSGNFDDRVLPPGPRAVIPYLEQLVLVPTEAFSVPAGNEGIRLSGVTADGFKVTIQVAVKARLNLESTSLVPFYNSRHRGSPLPVVRESLEASFQTYVANTSVQAFLPVVGRPVDIETALLPLVRQNLQAKAQAVQVESLHVQRIWNEPALQVPIDALRGARNSVNQLGDTIQRNICKDNPNC
ncbi:MAG: SPFH domain-containing protein [Candidatus Obscuribacter sp.]|nr:SPFH domain-containing protein [Candidatus Obscuribacter sp.]